MKMVTWPADKHELSKDEFMDLAVDATYTAIPKDCKLGMVTWDGEAYFVFMPQELLNKDGGGD